jgi:hypothetical protein
MQSNRLCTSYQPPMWSADKGREPVPVAGDAERPVSSAQRRPGPRTSLFPAELAKTVAQSRDRFA